MRDKNTKSLLDKRREHNQDLLRRMRSGESLRTVDSRASWFPPRPIIQKDQEAISKLYSAGTSDSAQTTNEGHNPQGEARATPVRRSRFDQVS
jgi:hypothetical protein